jgi:adenylate cyclase
MVDLGAYLASFRAEVSDEVATILAPSFGLTLTSTNFVPHSNDTAITFPNLDENSQGVKLLETTVLYVDMRRSTALSLKLHSHTVAKLYSAFIRAMTRCAKAFGGEVRGIIGDRVMILFDTADCFTNAIDTAVLINSVCQYVLNQHFTHDEVNFGIGIDFGRMLATKTGLRRHGDAQQSYHSLVWLGRPANVASKLTDQANKPEEAVDVVKARVAYRAPSGFGLIYQDEWPQDLVRRFTHNPSLSLMTNSNPAFHSWTTFNERVVTAAATPPILMSKRVLDGYRLARPLAEEILGDWYKPMARSIPEVPDTVFGGNVFYKGFSI